MITCLACGHAYEGPCENPGCVANPSIPSATKVRWVAEHERREREEMERAALQRIRERYS